MRRSLTIASLCALAVSGLAAGVAVTGLSANPGDGPPNQGDPDKVLTVTSGYECGGTVVAGPKVEGGPGRTITFTASSPIVKVTIKSGEKATLVSASWAADYRSGTITISQDVSNYVVWTCAGGSTTTGTTDTTTTTDTTPTTTETTPTTTETTLTTTETTPATTGTTPATTGTTPATTETTPDVTEPEPQVPLQPPAVPEQTDEVDEIEAPTSTRERAGVAGAQTTVQEPTPVLAHTP